MRALLIVVLLGLCGACDKLGEMAVEKATGVEVDKDGKKVTIKTNEGKVTMVTEGKKGEGTTVITTEDGEKAVMTAKDNQVRIESKEGSLTFGEQKVPDGFPLPVIAHDKVVTTAHAKKGDKQTFSLMLQTTKAPADVADFYQKALEDKGLKVQRMEHKMNDDVMINIVGKSKEVQAGVNAIRKGGEKNTQVMLHWNPS